MAKMKSKKLLIYFLILPLFTYVKAQPNSVESNQNIDLNLETKHVLYRGITNTILLSLPEAYCDKSIKASITKGSIEKVHKGKYRVVVEDGDKTTLIVKVRQTSGEYGTLKKQPFNLRDVPYPVPRLMGKIRGNISQKALKQADSLKLKNRHDVVIKNQNFEIKSFRWTYVPKTGNFKEVINEGSKLGPVIKKQFRNTEEQDRIIIQDIKVKGPNGIIKIPQAITLVVN